MFSVLLDHVLCGGCGRWTKSLQDDDADLWKDLSLQNSIPLQKSPPVPRVVAFPSDSDEFDDDDISTLYDPYHRRTEHDSEPPQEGERHDLDLRVEIVEHKAESDETVDDGRSCPHPRHPNHHRRYLHLEDDCDGSSYSSCKKLAMNRGSLRKQTLTWQTNLTDTTMQKHNIRSLTRAH
jgi:hypothetical protein